MDSELKFMYSEKATHFCEISNLFLSYVVPVTSKVEISQNFVAFSEYMNSVASLMIEWLLFPADVSGGSRKNQLQKVMKN